ncbi:hypothetical protein ACRALDRAFT_2016860 [Sodiomyces alcalophilus JCM 7366]|uniref:uncharacterized protein n=1 Tax=Sodiomyces alcalophilus JCM 7366 TaxID=591952 RepID=UPI0039B42D22
MSEESECSTLLYRIEVPASTLTGKQNKGKAYGPGSETHQLHFTLKPLCLVALHSNHPVKAWNVYVWIDWFDHAEDTSHQAWFKAPEDRVLGEYPGTTRSHFKCIPLSEEAAWLMQKATIPFFVSFWPSDAIISFVPEERREQKTASTKEGTRRPNCAYDNEFSPRPLCFGPLNRLVGYAKAELVDATNHLGIQMYDHTLLSFEAEIGRAAPTGKWSPSSLYKYIVSRGKPVLLTTFPDETQFDILYRFLSLNAGLVSLFSKPKHHAPIRAGLPCACFHYLWYKSWASNEMRTNHKKGSFSDM